MPSDATTSTQWPIPEGLSPLGRQAAETIVAFLTEHNRTFHGGGGTFYTPQQWAERGERYGTESTSQLVIVHDGGDHAAAFNWDYDEPAFREALRARLDPLGVYPEQCTSWYSAIYTH